MRQTGGLRFQRDIQRHPRDGPLAAMIATRVPTPTPLADSAASRLHCSSRKFIDLGYHDRLQKPSDARTSTFHAS